jgi:hypothetical protein
VAEPPPRIRTSLISEAAGVAFPVDFHLLQSPFHLFKSDRRLISMATSKDKDSKKDSASKDSASTTGEETKSPAAERRTFAKTKPDKPGEKDGDVKDGYRWDKGANDWMDHRGIDFSADPSQLPHNWEHTGDGSPERPHQVRQRSVWS